MVAVVEFGDNYSIIKYFRFRGGRRSCKHFHVIYWKFRLLYILCRLKRLDIPRKPSWFIRATCIMFATLYPQIPKNSISETYILPPAHRASPPPRGVLRWVLGVSRHVRGTSCYAVPSCWVRRNVSHICDTIVPRLIHFDAMLAARGWIYRLHL